MESSPDPTALERIEGALGRLEARVEVLEALALERAKNEQISRPATASTQQGAATATDSSTAQTSTRPEAEEKTAAQAAAPAAQTSLAPRPRIVLPRGPAVGPSDTSADDQWPGDRGRDGGWEQRVGGQWFTWLGAGSLALAVAFFIPWAWTHFQMAPSLRVLMFHLTGVGLFAAAWVMGRREMPGLSHALAALAVFVLYGSAYAMEHHYQLFGDHSNLAALIDCSLITAGAVIAAVRYSSPAIVLLGVLGGYVIPLIPPRPADDFGATFSYLLFLNIALLTAATVRAWSFIKPIAVVATAVMFLFWMLDEGVEPWRCERMLLLHAAVFLAGVSAPAFMRRAPSTGFDLTAIALNSLWLVGATWLLFHNRPAQQMAMVCWGMSLLHGMLFAGSYLRLSNADRLPRIHLALAAVFFTLATPLQMRDSLHYLAYAWSIEAFVFTAIGVYFHDRQMTTTGLLVYLLASMRALAFDFTDAPMLVGASSVDRRFLVMLLVGAAGLATASCHWWVARLNPANSPTPNRHGRKQSALLGGLGNVLLLLSCLCQWEGRTVLLLWTIDAALIWGFASAARGAAIRNYATAISLLFVGGRALYHGASLAAPFQLVANYRFLTLGLAAALYFAASWSQRRVAVRAASGNATSLKGSTFATTEYLLHVLGHVILLAAITFEIHNYWQPTGDLQTLFTSGKSREEHVAYSVAWALYGAALVAYGFAAKYRLPRLLGLIGLLAVAVKVFFVDLANLPLILRVFSLAALGALLLVTSFWYQKFTTRLDSGESRR